MGKPRQGGQLVAGPPCDVGEAVGLWHLSRGSPSRGTSYSQPGQKTYDVEEFSWIAWMPCPQPSQRSLQTGWFHAPLRVPHPVAQARGEE